MISTGKVKWFNQRGLGFIIPDDGGRDVFIHYSNITGQGFKMLVAGESVEFELVITGRGPQAFNLRRLAVKEA